MKTAIIVHGAPPESEYFDPNCPSPSNDHWIPWLQKQLLIRDYAAHAPEIPQCYAPHYPVWKRELERFDINKRTILVGHSCGGGFLARWLSDNRDVHVGRVVLVAPWIDPYRYRTSDFFKFEIDPDLASRTDGFAVFNSDNDAKDIQESAYILRDTVKNCYFREFHEYGHFCKGNLGSERFPELLDLLVN